MNKSAELSIFNYGDGIPDEELLRQLKNQIEIIRKGGFEIDEIKVMFGDRPKYQSNPQDGNLPKKE